MADPGFIYFASNPAFPGLLKVGMTSLDPQSRLQALDTTGLPRGFVLEFSCRVRDARGCETALHGILAGYRDTSEREFFRLEPPRALELCASTMGAFLFVSGMAMLPSVAVIPILPEITARVLSFVAEQNDYNQRAYTYDVAGCLGLSENEAILMLGELKELKYVKSLSEGRGIQYWVPLHKGLRYLKEHPTKWMREEV